MSKEINVSLSFFSDDGDPNVVTSLLKIEPSESFRKGDGNYGKSGRLYGLHSRSGWILTRVFFESDDISKSIKSLFELMPISRPLMQKILENGFGSNRLYVGLFGFYESTDFWIDLEVIKILNDLQIKFGMSYYCVPSE